MIKKRSIAFNGRKTSISLEDEFWHQLRLLAEAERITISEFVLRVADQPGRSNNLSSALRVFVLQRALGGGDQVVKREAA